MTELLFKEKQKGSKINGIKEGEKEQMKAGKKASQRKKTVGK